MPGRQRDRRYSALESLEAINARLIDLGISFHLSEVKGPVMDRLKRTDFIDHLSGQVFLSRYQAICDLDPGALWSPAVYRPQSRETPAQMR